MNDAMVNVQIDGVWHRFPRGTRVMEACRQVGKFIPHYCYHPQLSAPGNCRMCMVEMGVPRLGADRRPELGPDGHPVINWLSRPQISCAQEVGEGMAIRTDSPLARECRRSVMEFLLINHPLDCPICDQAGECRLQEFSVEYGAAESRFLERKVKKPKNVALGPRVTLDGERCILCTRCIRFMREIAKDDVLGIVDRGGHSTIAVHPGRLLESNYSLNTVDLCPVGALTATDFRFKMRVWFLRETPTICTGCATGCNSVLGSRQNTVYRQTPRRNDAVNAVWMCDRGRLKFHEAEAADRPTAPLVRRAGDDGRPRLEPATWPAALAAAVDGLCAHPGDKLGIIVGGSLTNEELFLVAKLVEATGTALVDVVPQTGAADGILVAADRNANTNGARAFGLATGKLPEIARAVPPALLVIGDGAVVAGAGVPGAPGAAEVSGGIDFTRAKWVLVVGTRTPVPPPAGVAVVLPGAAPAEKRGTMINGQGRLQRLNRAVPPPGEARDDWEILRDLLLAFTGGDGGESFAELSAATAAALGDALGAAGSAVPAWGAVGDLGVQLALPWLAATGAVVATGAAGEGAAGEGAP